MCGGIIVNCYIANKVIGGIGLVCLVMVIKRLGRTQWVRVSEPPR